MPSITQPPLGPIYVHGAVQNSKVNGICLPTSINESTSALVSSISPQSSSDFDTHQGEIIDKTKQVAQSVNQMLLKTTTGNPTSNLTLSNSSQDRTPDRKSILILNPSDIHTQTKTQPTHTYRPISPENSITNPVTGFKQTKQIIMDTDALSLLPYYVTKSYRG